MTISTSTLLWFAQANGAPSDAVIATLARYSTVYIWQYTDTTVGTDGILDLSWTDAIAERIRAVNPRVKIGLYGGQTAIVTPIDPGYAWFTDAELFHDAAGNPLIYHHPDPHHPQKVTRFPNLLDPAVRTKLVNGWCDLMDEHGFDCLMLDASSPDYYATLIRDLPSNYGYFGLPNGIGPGGAWRMDNAGWWQVVLTILGAQLRWRLAERGKTLMVVGLWPYPYDPTNPTHIWRGIGESNIVDHFGGAISEHNVEGYGVPYLFRDILDTLKRAADKRREVFVYALPWMLQQSIPTIDSLEFQRFCLATYLLIQEGPGTSFGYSDVQPFRGWSGPSYPPGGWQAPGYDNGPGTPYVFWSADWERDYGTPLQPYQTANDANGVVRLAWRSYTLGRTVSDYVIAVVNPTDQPQLTSFGGTWRVWDPETGPVVSGPITVPAKTGWVLWAA